MGGSISQFSFYGGIHRVSLIETGSEAVLNHATWELRSFRKTFRVKTAWETMVV